MNERKTFVIFVCGVLDTDCSFLVVWRLAETCYHVVSAFMRRVTVLLDTTAPITKPDKNVEVVNSNKLLLHQVTPANKIVHL